MTTYYKDPDANLDYTFDWAAWLVDDDTITAHTIVVPTGITLGVNAHTDTAVTYWLTGGTVDVSYDVRCRITTTAGRIDDRTDTIQVRQK